MFKHNKTAFRKTLLASLAGTMLMGFNPVFADYDGNDNRDNNKKGCTAEAIAAADAYDPGSSEFTTCIKKRNHVKVIVAWNNNAVNGKILKTTGATVGQQVVNVRNLATDYENNYDMAHGDEFDTVVVAYASGVDWLKTTTDQANQDMINALMAKGIKIYACQNTMKAKGFKLADLLPGVEIVPAGVSAIVDFQNQGMTLLIP